MGARAVVHPVVHSRARIAAPRVTRRRARTPCFVRDARSRSSDRPTIPRRSSTAGRSRRRSRASSTRRCRSSRDRSASSWRTRLRDFRSTWMRSCPCRFTSRVSTSADSTRPRCSLRPSRELECAAPRTRARANARDGETGRARPHRATSKRRLGFSRAIARARANSPRRRRSHDRRHARRLCLALCARRAARTCGASFSRSRPRSDSLVFASLSVSNQTEWRWADPTGQQRLVREDELRSAIASGVIPANAPVWTRGWTGWKPAHDVPELNGKTPPPPTNGDVPPPPNFIVDAQDAFEGKPKPAPAGPAEPPPPPRYVPLAAGSDTKVDAPVINLGSDAMIVSATPTQKATPAARPKTAPPPLPAKASQAPAMKKSSAPPPLPPGARRATPAAMAAVKPPVQSAAAQNLANLAKTAPSPGTTTKPIAAEKTAAAAEHVHEDGAPADGRRAAVGDARSAFAVAQHAANRSRAAADDAEARSAAVAEGSGVAERTEQQVSDARHVRRRAGHDLGCRAAADEAACRRRRTRRQSSCRRPSRAK